ncbi:unnamed protein product [Citrullus colocynthis]|uniref:Uncharacterized protein n=1 Tax=Citrullus colocynthis TaxID=252529 RepID=A0ABP0Y4Y5_9ROSI
MDEFTRNRVKFVRSHPAWGTEIRNETEKLKSFLESPVFLSLFRRSLHRPSSPSLLSFVFNGHPLLNSLIFLVPPFLILSSSFSPLLKAAWSKSLLNLWAPECFCSYLLPLRHMDYSEANLPFLNDYGKQNCSSVGIMAVCNLVLVVFYFYVFCGG